jgi:hypothetical protein
MLTATVQSQTPLHFTAAQLLRRVLRQDIEEPATMAGSHSGLTKAPSAALGMAFSLVST